MSNILSLAGAQPQKQTRFAPIYTGRWSSGIWTNRSPLRDANTTRLTEKFYGASGDALIAGSNVEITHRLTLARRPGNSAFDTVNTYNAPDRFYDFRLFNATTEQINVMVDQANALYSLYSGTKSLVWTKAKGAGQSYMQSVGNSLYWGDGVSNKKWLQTLTTWSAGATWNGPSLPFLSTFFLDGNGNIQQLTGTAVPVTQVQVTGNVLTATSSYTLLNSVLRVGLEMQFPATGMQATFLEGQTVTVTGVTANTFSATFVEPNYLGVENGVLATEITGGATPISNTLPPIWSTVTPSAQNNYQGGITQDGTVQWTNRGNPVENWGIQNTAPAPVTSVGQAGSAWHANTYYSPLSVILDPNGNVQQVVTAGVSGKTQPSWGTTLNGFTYDGAGSSIVTWKMIQTAASLTWAAHTNYAPGSLLVAPAGGTNCLFKMSTGNQPSLTGGVNAYLYNGPHSGAVGCFVLTNPTTTSGALAQATNLSGFDFYGGVPGVPVSWNTMNGAGEVTGTTTPFPGYTQNYQLILQSSLNIPVAGAYSFSIAHHDGMIWGIGNGAQLVNGTNDNPSGQTVTAASGYPVMGGTNRGLQGGGLWTDNFTVNFPTAGVYPVEIDYSYWYHSTASLSVRCNGQVIPSGPTISGSTQPLWPAWTTANAPAYPAISEAAGQISWQNMGPATDFAWAALTGFTLPGTTIIDPAGGKESPYRTGSTGSTQPKFLTTLNALTIDNPNLIWINTGQSTAPPVGAVSTYAGGWQYGVALVNTLDNTVSNISSLSTQTGNFVGALGVTLTPGAGLPPVSSIDPQADYVAIFRTTDGQSTPFLIPGANTTYTLPLAQYLSQGYTDSTPDTGLNNLISAPVLGENTPPGAGAQNLTFHLNRIFFSIGNTVFWTSGPDTPVGNGANGVNPLNYDNFPSLVKRLMPTASGLMVFTVSDVYLIPGNGTATNPIQSGIPVLQGIGLQSYNALDVNGSIIGFYTTDSQFCIIDPSAGVSYAGFPIGDQLRQNTGAAGTSWNPANVYVAWHVNGEDQAWYVSDGQFGWYRLMPTPAPESGYTWSPFTTVVGGCKAVQSIEVSPGSHQLLLGPAGKSGSLLKRDLSVNTDNGVPYPAWAVVGSAVLAQPGQVAIISFITTESVRVGTPLTLGLLLDEALPYFTGPFETLKEWESDPPGMKPSRSFYGQRFYLAEMDEEAACRHMQVMVQWAAEDAPNELLSLTMYGGFMQES